MTPTTAQIERAPKMPWRPISQYTLEMGHVLVWLAWPEYTRSLPGMTVGGNWLMAYPVKCGAGNVWVGAHDSIPVETTGRSITHFMQKESP